MDTDGALAEDTEQLVERVQELQERLRQAARRLPRKGLAEELVSAVVQMYGAGLERIVGCPRRRRRRAGSLAREDELVGTLLLIHDLHPVPLEQRVQDALDSVRPYMESHGGNVELLSLEHGVARIHLRGSCSDCSASSVTLELAIKQALEEMAPDLEGLQVEGMAAQTVPGQGPADGHGGRELPMVRSSPRWRAGGSSPAGAAPALGEPRSGAITAVSVAGRW